MSRIANLVSQEVRSLPGIRSSNAHVGRAITGDQVVAVNSAELWIGMDPAANYDQTLAAIKRVVQGYPGIHSDVQTYLDKTSSEALAGAGDPVSVRVYGEDWEVLRRLSNDVKTAIDGVPGVVDTKVKLPIEEPNVEIEVDVVAAQRQGIRPGDVRRTAATMLAGLQVGSLFEEQKVFDVVVWSTPATRRSLSSIADLMISTPTGGLVRLGDLAKMRIAPAPSVIRRDATSRYIDIGANVQGRDLGAVTRDVQARLGQIQFPREYHAAVLDDYAAGQAARTRLLVIAAATLIGIFFVLQAAFNGWRLAALSFLTLPAALVGGLLAALVGGAVLSIGSLIGFLAVFAIAARNSVMLIRHYQHLEQHEGETFGSGLAVRGAAERLTPILMTALATGLAFLPLVVAGDIPGLEILHPMAVVVVGGLVTSTLLNLFVVPVLFSILKASPARGLELDFVSAPAAATAGAAGN
jgi:Cu/Ag efflux pump CusA